jgi:deoxyribose-phosphate aldolase
MHDNGLPPYEEIAKMIDHALLTPTLSVAGLEAGLAQARDYGVATVCILPYYVAPSVRALAGSDVLTSTTIGFPHGVQASAVKQAEAARALDDGASELDMVVNVSQVLSGGWAYVADEIRGLVALCHERGAKLKLIFENVYLEERHKLRLCALAGELAVDWVKTSTGFAPGGATLADVELMRRAAPASVQVKAAGGVRDLATLLSLRPFVTRIGTSHTRTILDELRARSGLVPIVSADAPLGGY